MIKIVNHVFDFSIVPERVDAPRFVITPHPIVIDNRMPANAQVMIDQRVCEIDISCASWDSGVTSVENSGSVSGDP